MKLPGVYTKLDAGTLMLDINELILEYGSISVVDVYDLIGRQAPLVELPVCTYKDNKRGWTDDGFKLRKLVRVDGGCQIEISDPVPLA